MNAQEKRLARTIKRALNRFARAERNRGFRATDVEHVQVKLARDGKSYAYVSGPEMHRGLGAPRRLRKVWTLRMGCPVEEQDRVTDHPSCAYGGFAWGETREEVMGKAHEFTRGRCDMSYTAFDAFADYVQDEFPSFDDELGELWAQVAPTFTETEFQVMFFTTRETEARKVLRNRLRAIVGRLVVS